MLNYFCVYIGKVGVFFARHSLTLLKNNGMYEIAYNKNAFSVIENVVYAHDAELYRGFFQGLHT